ncbi:hypothetical protein E2C01_048940 [Portunus trituberculatus]|uniref:Uncharacterized protein n=1 Tax=Portunus trituberculatus TaxID=210409 RepID=A0A5B7GBI0_PORTR|nr:hypothetical protein [Portunus trituberculatus]
MLLSISYEVKQFIETQRMVPTKILTSRDNTFLSRIKRFVPQLVVPLLQPNRHTLLIIELSSLYKFRTG